MTVREILDDFLGHHAEHSKPPTVRFYRQGLAWFARDFAAVAWGELDRAAVKAAMLASSRRPDGSSMAPATVRRNRLAFAQLQRHAVEQRFGAELLTVKDLAKPGSGRREEIPSAAELDRLEAEASPAFAAALRALRRSAMRPGELCRVDVSTIEAGEDGGRAIVLREHKTAGKTGKPRRIALGGGLAAEVDAAIAGRPEGPVWLDELGRRWSPGLLSLRFRTLRKRLGLSPKLTLYTVRHYAGTAATKAAGIHAAKELLGHTSITMTQRYAHGDDADQLAAQRAIEEAERKRAA